MSDLPAGFEIVKRPSAAGDLPPGFVIQGKGAQSQPERSTAGALWESIKGGASKGGMAALWEGIKTGAGDVLRGGGQLIAKTGATIAPSPQARTGWQQAGQALDQQVREREQAWQQDPVRTAHPAMAGTGRVAGNVAATAPLAFVGGVPASIGGRLAMGGALGAGAGVLEPVTNQGNFATEKLKQVGAGAAGGLAGGALGEIVGSTLGRAIAGNNARAADDALLSTYRRTVKPSRVGQQAAPQLAQQDRRILTAVDQIIENRHGVRLTDSAGADLPRGSLPRSIRQFSEAIDQTKNHIFRQYDAMAEQAGGTGIRVGLLPAAQELRNIANSTAVRDLSPAVRADAERLAETFERRLFYSPSEAQDAIQHLNKILAPTYRGAPTHETVSHATVLAPVARALREGLDTAIEGATGPGYQALRTQYGALRSIEKDVAGAVQREANKIPGGLAGTFADIGTAEELFRGVVTMNPRALATAGGLRAARAAVKYLNDPNRAITRMFDRRTQPISGPLRSGIGGSIQQYASPVAGALGGDVLARAVSPAR